MKKIIYISIIIIFFAIYAKAEIIYTDIEPDSTLNGSITAGSIGIFKLDIDNDGSVDFEMWQHHYFENADAVQLFSSQYKQSEALTDDNGLRALSKDVLINSQQSEWYNSHSSSMSTTHYWRGLTDKYAGLRFKINSNWHYGWIRFDVAQDESWCIIKDYAYQSEPNTGISAGETGSTFIKSKSEEYQLKVEPIITENFIIIREIATGTSIQILNSIGQVIYERNIENVQELVNIANFPSGIYFIKYDNYIQKLLIMK